MAAFLVFTRTATKDPAEMATYSSMAGRTFKGHAVTPHVAYGAQEILEGEAHEGMVILSFPTADEAKAWYDSPAYKEAREYRFRGADYQVTLVEGV